MSTIQLFSNLREERCSLYKIIAGVFSITACYAVLHDQYIVRIAPEHFTVYHGPILGLRKPWLLAAAWAFLASVAPGTILGILCGVAARLGSRPQVSVRAVLKITAIVVIATEFVSAPAGLITFLRAQGIYPDSVYPDKSLPLVVTQTIQLTCYAASALFSLGAIAVILHRRFRQPIATPKGPNELW